MSEKKGPTEARVWSKTISEGTCRSCSQRIIWAKLVKSGKSMPFDRIVTIREFRDEESQDLIQLVSLQYTHFSSCPQAKGWSNRGGSSGRSRPASTPTANVSNAIAELKEAQSLLRKQYQDTQTQTIVDAGQAIRRALTLLGTG